MKHIGTVIDHAPALIEPSNAECWNAGDRICRSASCPRHRPIAYTYDAAAHYGSPVSA